MPINNALTRWLSRQVDDLVQGVMDRRPPDFVIGPKDDPYLMRWWAIPRNPIFNVYIHSFEKSDDDRALHDHPFASVSLALRGAMEEIYLHRERAPEIDLPFSRGYSYQTLARPVTPGDLIYRGAKFAHRMVVPTPGSVTLFITGPRIREWGFLTSTGWVAWREFLKREGAR